MSQVSTCGVSAVSAGVGLRLLKTGREVCVEKESKLSLVDGGEGLVIGPTNGSVTVANCGIFRLCGDRFNGESVNIRSEATEKTAVDVFRLDRRLKSSMIFGLGKTLQGGSLSQHQLVLFFQEHSELLMSESGRSGKTIFVMSLGVSCCFVHLDNSEPSHIDILPPMFKKHLWSAGDLVVIRQNVSVST